MAQKPFDVINDATMGVVLSNCLNAVTAAGVADALGDAPQSAEELAKATATHAGALHRILRMLASYGIFEARDGAYAHSPASRFLRADHPQSLRGYVLLCALPSFQKGFGSLAYSLHTGRPAIEKSLPEGTWKHLASHPEEARVFAVLRRRSWTCFFPKGSLEPRRHEQKPVIGLSVCRWLSRWGDLVSTSEAA